MKRASTEDPTLLSQLEETILILAPLGRDAKLAAAALAQAGLRSEVQPSLGALCARLTEPHGALLITEEAIDEDLPRLKERITAQEAWSDLPVVLLTSNQMKAANTQRILDHFSVGGNISLLERPFHVMTLVTALEVAIRSRRRQYQVRDLLRQQAQALCQRDDFLSIASHELKTPITSLQLQVQLREHVRQRGDPSVYLPEKVDSFFKKTAHQVDRISRLVDDMLDVSRIENGKLVLQPEPCDLRAIVLQVLDNFAGQFQSAGCEVHLDLREGATGLWDRYRIEQVTTNLFTNAIKYGAGRPVEIRVWREGDQRALSVRDHGLGIAKKDHKRVFQRFERAVSGTSISGLGLGLYILKQIVEMHGARVLLESDVGLGSTFTVKLPQNLTKSPAMSSS